MIRIERIEVKNFKSIPNASVNLEKGKIYLVYGENGVGKTALFVDALIGGLFGPFRKDPYYKGLLMRGRKAKLAVEFSIGNERYRVEREVQHDGEWRHTARLYDLNSGRLLAGKITEVENFVHSLVGMKFANFKRVAVIHEGELDVIVRADPQDVRRLFTEVSGLDELVKECGKKAKEKLNQVAKEREKLREELGELEAEFKLRQKELEELEEEARSLETSLKELESEVEAIEARISRLSRLEAEKRSLEAEKEKLNAERELLREKEKELIVRRKEISLKLKQAEKIEENLDSLRKKKTNAEEELTQIKEELTPIEERIRKLKDEKSKLKAELEEVSKETSVTDEKMNMLAPILRAPEEFVQEKCPICRRPITPETIREHLPEIEEEYQSLSRRKEELVERKRTLELALKEKEEEEKELCSSRDKKKGRIEELEKSLAFLSERISSLEKELNELRGEELREEMSKIEEELARISEKEKEIRERVSGVEEKLRYLEDEMRKIMREKGVYDEKKKELEARRKELEEVKRRIPQEEEEVSKMESEIRTKKQKLDRLEKEQKIWDMLANYVFKEGGYIEELLKVLYRRLEKEATEFVQTWYSNYTIRIQTEMKRGLLTPKFYIHDGADMREFSTYSRGERATIATALRIALMSVVPEKKGRRAAPRTLIIDEGLPQLDKQNLRTYAETLEDMVESGVFDNVVLICTDQLFDHLRDAFRRSDMLRIIRVEKGGKLSFLA